MALSVGLGLLPLSQRPSPEHAASADGLPRFVALPLVGPPGCQQSTDITERLRDTLSKLSTFECE